MSYLGVLYLSLDSALALLFSLPLSLLPCVCACTKPLPSKLKYEWFSLLLAVIGGFVLITNQRYVKLSSQIDHPHSGFLYWFIFLLSSYNYLRSLQSVILKLSPVSVLYGFYFSQILSYSKYSVHWSLFYFNLFLLLFWGFNKSLFQSKQALYPLYYLRGHIGLYKNSMHNTYNAQYLQYNHSHCISIVTSY